MNYKKKIKEYYNFFRQNILPNFSKINKIIYKPSN